MTCDENLNPGSEFYPVSRPGVKRTSHFRAFGSSHFPAPLSLDSRSYLCADDKNWGRAGRRATAMMRVLI